MAIRVQKEYWGELGRSHRLWNMHQMRRCDCAAIQTESEVFKLRHSSDSTYPEFRSTTLSRRFLFAKEQFLPNLADQNSTIALTMVKKISLRGQSSGVADLSSSALVASCNLSHQCSNLTCHPRPMYKALLRNSALINYY